MNRKHEIIGMSQAESMIGPGVKVEGDLVSEGDIIIDGQLKGRVKSGGDVVVGLNADVKADIEARSVSVSGKLDGDVVAKEQVSLTETARLQGNIQCSSLAVGAGALFSGQVKMTIGESKAPEDTA